MTRGSSFTARVLTAVLVVLGLSLAANLVGCGGSSTQPPTGIMVHGPASDTIDPGDSASFTATVTNDVHNAGVSWAVTGTGCAGSACGTLSNSTTTGVTYTAPATVTTAFTVTLTVTSVADSAVTTTVTLTIPVNPTITTTAGSLAGGVVGTPYAVTLAGAGGISPYAWSVTQGALPVGLTLNATTGVLSGTPNAAGTASFTVTLTDSGSPALTASTAFSIAVVYPALVINTTTLPTGLVGAAYTAMLSASGGSGTGYTWTVTSGTGLSAVGLNLSASGAITGSPTSGETAVPVTVQVTDSAGDTATATLMLTVATAAFQGQVLSGQQPVSGATIQLYTVGSTGNGSAASPMLTQTVTTNSSGIFSFAGLYTCGQNSAGSTIAGTGNQVYFVATGGSTSLTTTSGNSALAMVTAIGSCSNLASTPLFIVNEITTAAAAWALAPFSASATNIGATSTNTLGITNAFLDAALLANPATGASATLPTGLTVETGKLAAFADVLNTCTASADGTGCSTLFAAATPASGTVPADSFQAALNIVQNPGQNVAAVYAALPTTGTPPFTTTLTASPNDWTMSLTVTGGGLLTPTALGIDSLNNIWVADEDGPLSAFNAQGTPLSSTGYGIVSGASLISNVFGLAIDPSNNIWVTNEQGYQGGGDGSITEFYGVNNPSTFPTGTSPQPTGYTTNVFFPVSIAADTNSNIYVANTGTFTSVSIYSNTGNVLAPALGVSVATSAGQNSIAIDTSNGFWLSDNAGAVEHFSSTGNLLDNAACCSDSLGIATDSAGNLWIADYLGGADGHGAIAEAVTDSSGNTSVPITNLTTGGINYPQAVVVDSAQNIWFANKLNGSITELAGINNTLAVSTAISPSTGVYGTGGYGLDGKLLDPFSLLPDRSGNLWVSNEGGNSLTMFFGLAAPTVTPLQPVPTAP
jgi:hypothetical protein